MLTVVTGPPCSGKSTYVRTHVQPGDVIVDFDVMAQALGSPTPHEHSVPIRHVTIMARRAAIAAALSVANQTGVWIVDCNPGAQRMGAYLKAGARIVTLGADKAELHRRADAERPALWHRLIDQWQPLVGADVGSRDW